MMRSRRGFSLLEVLLAATLGALALLAVMGLFAGGLRVAGRLGVSQEDIGLALAWEQVGRDLRNAFPFYEIPFDGHRQSLEFAGWSRDTTPPRPVRIRYDWDERRGILWRSETPFPGESATRTDVLIDGLVLCEWSYLNPEATDTANPGWLESWDDPASPPPAIRWDLRRPGTDRPAQRRILTLPRGLHFFYGNT